MDCDYSGGASGSQTIGFSPASDASGADNACKEFKIATLYEQSNEYRRVIAMEQSDTWENYRAIRREVA